MTFQWRGGYLTREVLQELLELIRKAGEERQKTARISLNWPQAVIHFSYVDNAGIPEPEVIMEDANDYYFPPVTGIYLRIVRYLTALVTTFLTPLWFLALCYPQDVPSALSFIVPQDPGAVPVLLQLLILEISIDGLKLASLNTPTLMSTTMSVLGAVIIGDLAIDTGWFCAESLFYMGFVALSNFSMPSYELSYAFKFSRIILLILTGLFGIWGFAGGVVLMFLMMLFNKTFLGYKFLYPFIPFDPQKIRKKIRKMLGYNDPHDKTA